MTKTKACFIRKGWGRGKGGSGCSKYLSFPEILKFGVAVKIGNL